MYIKKTFKVKENKKLEIGRDKRKKELFNSYRKMGIKTIFSTNKKNVHLI